MSATAIDRPLAGRIVPQSGVGRAAGLALLAVLGSVVLWVSANVSVPFYPVPMTLQTCAVMAIGAAYGWRLGTVTILLYLAEGASGLPVFTGTPQQGLGLAYMLGPTGGFLAGFVVAAFVIGWLAERGFDRDPLRLSAAMLAGDVLLFLLGLAWLAWFAVLPNGGAGIGFDRALAGGVTPFLLGDAVKIVLAACLVSAGGLLVRR